MATKKKEEIIETNVEEVIDAEFEETDNGGEIITVEEKKDEKVGLITKTKNWCVNHKSGLIKIGVGLASFAGGLLIGETIGKTKSINAELIDTDLTGIGLESNDIDVDIEEF